MGIDAWLKKHELPAGELFCFRDGCGQEWEGSRFIDVSDLRELLKTHVIVPREPTQSMCEAPLTSPPLVLNAAGTTEDMQLCKAGWSHNAIINRKRYKAMLAAATKGDSDGQE